MNSAVFEVVSAGQLELYHVSVWLLSAKQTPNFQWAVSSHIPSQKWFLLVDLTLDALLLIWVFCVTGSPVLAWEARPAPVLQSIPIVLCFSQPLVTLTNSDAHSCLQARGTWKGFIYRCKTAYKSDLLSNSKKNEEEKPQKTWSPQSWTTISSCCVAQAVWIFRMRSFVFQGEEWLQHDECSSVISDVPVNIQSPGLKSTQMTHRELGNSGGG